MSAHGTGRTWLRRGLAALAAVAVLLGMLMVGFYAHRQGDNPLSSLVARVERKLAKVRNEPTQTEGLTAQIETTFLRLRGKVYQMPGNDYVRGGAMTVWGPELLVMNHAGRVFRVEDGAGLQPLDALQPPPNGLADYEALARTPPYDTYLHKFSQFRFNDITHVEAGDLRGLAMSYTFFDKARACYGTRVAWLPLAPDATPASLSAGPDDWQVIFETYPCQPLNPNWTAIDAIQAGGRMAFKAPSTLYLGSGDYALDGIHTYDAGLQSDDSSYGKVMAIDLKTRQSRIVSKGHRNLQGIAIDKEGRLWTTEHGERGGDELNLIEEGVDYGWPSQSLGTLYSGLPLPTKGRYGRHDLYRQPVFAWLPSAAISSLTVIDGIDPSWDGDLLAGSLSSPVFGQSLWHVRIDGQRVVFVERIRLARRVRHVVQWKDRIAVWLDSNELVIFTPERQMDPLSRIRERLPGQFGEPLAAKISETLDVCNRCHSFDENVQTAAPSLNGVVGRRIAGTTFDGYSPALAGHGGVWNADTLEAFLNDPEGFAPGTVMPDPGLSGRDDLISGLIRVLEDTDTEGETDLSYN